MSEGGTQTGSKHNLTKKNALSYEAAAGAEGEHQLAECPELSKDEARTKGTALKRRYDCAKWGELRKRTGEIIPGKRTVQKKSGQKKCILHIKGEKDAVRHDSFEQLTHKKRKNTAAMPREVQKRATTKPHQKNPKKRTPTQTPNAKKNQPKYLRDWKESLDKDNSSGATRRHYQGLKRSRSQKSL